MASVGGAQPFAQTWQVPTFTVDEFAPRRTHYCVCIPVINEGERIRLQLQRIAAAGIPASTDVLILDGGSTDGSLAPTFLQQQGVRSLLVKTGPGKLSAQLRMGYAYALTQGYTGIITVDGNNKDGVEAIPAFMDALDQGYDFVQGSRFITGGNAINTPLERELAVKLIHIPLTRLASGFPYTDTTNGFRAYSVRLLTDPRVQPFREVFNQYELLVYLSIRAAQLGFKVTEIPVTRMYPAGKTPTKITAIRGNAIVFATLIKGALGQYAP